MMDSKIVNVFLTSFPGLDLPSTLSLPVPGCTTISGLASLLIDRLPDIDSRLIITTTSNKQIAGSSLAPITSLLSNENDTLVSLRLSVPLCGGKGGFGSQLRAAGGRMSSKRKRNQGENNGSNRNLDGRRLRTVIEAKALAEYLALKPDMDKKEKEARRKRWEQVVELAERREEEIRHGLKGRVDGKWIEDKEEAGERTREAVLAVMRSGDYTDTRLGLGDEASALALESLSEKSGDEGNGESSSQATTLPWVGTVEGKAPATYFGFDEDDEFLSDDEEAADGEIEKGCGEDCEAQEKEASNLENQVVEDRGKGKA